MAAGGLLLTGACDPAATPSAATPAQTTPGQTTPGTASAGAVAGASPVVEKRTVTRTQKIPFKTRKVNDATLAKGDTKVVKRGATGLKKLTYEVTLTNGAETSRKLIREAVTRRPVTRVIAVGTKQARRCDPNYSGCVPIARDVDCAGGSGDGPGYVSGPVRVVGDDIYDLDRDGDGIACDT
ncbi:G5 domain-containing protein [Actinomadura sp. B10D3]|uniref:G5 domain-containing protein n=1 Tax=Actinomadura sp. B10D3 TaxID=3153557 RepID=UPI00325D0C17